MTLLEPIMNFLVAGQHSRKITLQQVVTGADRDRVQVLRVLDRLAAEGYLVQVSDQPLPPKLGESGPQRRNPTWRITGDLSSRPTTTPRKNTNRDKLWRLIRAKRRFTTTDLVVASGVKADTVDQYVRQLAKNGYIRKTGKDGGLVTYMLVAISQVQRPVGMDGGAA